MANIIPVEFMQGAQSLADEKNTKVPNKKRKAPNNNPLQKTIPTKKMRPTYTSRQAHGH